MRGLAGSGIVAPDELLPHLIANTRHPQMARSSDARAMDVRNRSDLTLVQTGREEVTLMLTTLLLVILILAFFGGLPTWPHSRDWGYGPSGVSGLLLIIVIILLLTRGGTF